MRMESKCNISGCLMLSEAATTDHHSSVICIRYSDNATDTATNMYLLALGYFSSYIKIISFRRYVCPQS